MARIEIVGLGKCFGPHVALDALHLDIADHQFITLLGPSGCGKTTTLRLLAGFMEPDSGQIAVDGAVLSSPAGSVPPERRGMGMVFQNYALWPHMSVFDNVAFGLTMQRVPAAEARRRVTDMLGIVGLEGVAGRSPSALSGGQQQRVALARSLVTEPSILLLDEPLSNLDAKLRERMRNELKDLQRRTGITFVYVTHDQSEALALSDRIAVMAGGRLQQYGPPLEIYERPANRFVADFMGAANLLDGTVEQAELGQGGAGQGGAGQGVVGQGVVALPGGARFAATLPAGAAAGDAVALMLRPEDMAICRQPPAAPANTPANTPANALAATVQDSVLLGGLMEYRVRAGTGAGAVSLRVQVPRGAGFAPGEAVWLSVPPERCIALP